MSIGELHGWAKYLSLEPHNSMEIQTALVAQVANNAMGGKAKLKDMLITSYNGEPKSPEEELLSSRPSDEAVMAAFGVFK